MTHKWTLEAGRLIMRDGEPFATIHRVARQDNPSPSPVDVDEFARLAAAAPAMREALRGVLDDADQSGGNRRVVTRYEIDRTRAALALAENVKP